MSVHVYGIRHHGPGCARALERALASLAPDCVLVEGPPDAQESLAYVAHEGLVPPVALLVHAVEDPSVAAMYPFASFSPEWQALRHGAERGVPVRFMDLPCAHTFAQVLEARKRAEEAATAENVESEDVAVQADDEDTLHVDPIGLLAEAAGYTDREQWWDVEVEQRRNATELFAAILEAMTALREAHPDPRKRNEQREAYMRTCIRAAQKEGFARIAVVCGAWHAPALAKMGPAKADAETLKGLPKTKVTASFIPWANARLATRSGYGAGVESPGFYAHLFAYEANAVVPWVIGAARLLRAADIDASSASVIETVRLAHTLAVVRELKTPGLRELRDAIVTVLCMGDHARLGLIREKLEIGADVGAVPEQATQVPLMRDFEREVKRLRLKLTTEQVVLELDLRKENDLAKSRLLHRLLALGVTWGRTVGSTSTGTFKEAWQTAWAPELAIDIVSANVHGNTVAIAASRALREGARAADIGALSRMLEAAIVAFLPDAIDDLLAELDARAATTSDVRSQLEAIAPLARLVRYGDVRATRAEHVQPVLARLFERVTVALPPACSQLDDEAAAALITSLEKAHAACFLLEDAALEADWLAALRGLLDTDATHPRIRGRITRLLLERRLLTEDELSARASLALSVGTEPAQAAQWLEGLVAGNGLLLVHQAALLATLDTWMASLAPEVFQAELPILRRAFSGLSGPERRAVAQQVKQTTKGAPVKPRAAAHTFHEARAAQVLPVFAKLLGVPHV